MPDASPDSFESRRTLEAGGRRHTYHSLRALEAAGFSGVSRLPVSLRVLLENLLRTEDGRKVTAGDIEALANWDAKAAPSREIAFTPARVILQDFTGVPAVVDLAAMRDAIAAMGGDARKINPLPPVDLVIDHSVQVDRYGSATAFSENVQIEYQRNLERYVFLRWGARALERFRVVPPGTGIVHQVNLEHLARVAFTRETNGESVVFPDTLVGTDSHTTMINGLGVVGWGVGGIEAEAAMLGQPISMLIPQVVGFKLTGRLRPGATATDLVLTVTELLRKKGVVGKFVEFYGDGISALSLPDRATLGNMSPEYGATIALFPVDDETLNYLRFTGRPASLVALTEAYFKEQGLFLGPDSVEPVFSDTLALDLGDVEPSLAGPKRPQDRVPLRVAKQAFRESLAATLEADKKGSSGAAETGVPVSWKGEAFELRHGAVVIAAITSCTNTSNPTVMVAAGLLARNAVKRGLNVMPWVKTSLAPGSQVVTEYLKATGLSSSLDALGFNLVGYGCTTCIGNSGPLPEPIGEAVKAGHLVAVSVLSGNRNFEGRINPLVRGNYLASPPLVVAYALAGTMDIDFERQPLGTDQSGTQVFLRDLWPSPEEIARTVREGIQSEMFQRIYGDVFRGDEAWAKLPVPEGDRYAWDPKSTYIKRPPFFDKMPAKPAPLEDVRGARVLAMLGGSVTTDHISPAGSIAEDSPAGRYLKEHGVERKDFNSFGSRRGNHEVMMRGTFGNVRLRNQLAPGTEGPWTRHLPDGEKMFIYDAAMKYAEEGVPLIVLAGEEYGAGSSRDWAAKGTRLLGVRAVIAKSYERIHRSNLIGMGVLPLQHAEGEDRESLGLTGEEIFSIDGIAGGISPLKKLAVVATGMDGAERRFTVVARIDTPNEVDYFRHGGILQYVLRSLLEK
ncbi:MAG: aconitate hydratase AcnA [Deltaproteobacteria bacterium]|nr:aconitate hydratase AcnA [Deltaproteobacteria bacterium]